MPGSSDATTPDEPSTESPGTPRRAAVTATIPAGPGPVGSPNAAGSTPRSTAGSTAPSDHRPGPLADWCRGHAVFGVVLLVGIAWRILVRLAFSPAFLMGESRFHLTFVGTGVPSPAQPAGYGVLELTPLSWFSDALSLVTGAQHVLGLATGVVIYVLLLRWGVWRWLAALATVPVLWDPYELVSEHLVLPDTLNVFLLAVALLVLCWRARPTPGAALVAGVLLGAAATVRLTNEPLVVVAVVFMLLAGATWRTRVVGALVVVIGFGLPVGTYAAWYHHVHGEYALSHSQAGVDPGRATRAGGSAALGRPRVHDLPTAFAALFDWPQTDRYDYRDVGTWRFGSYVPPKASPTGDSLYADHGGAQLEAHQPAADALVSYQDHGPVPGPVLLGCLLLALLAGLGIGRAASSGMRAVCLLSAAVPAGVLFGAVSTAEFSWRNQLPGLVLWPVAGALGLTALMRGRRSPDAARAQVDNVDRAALDTFRERYGHPALAQVAVVIAAYNESVGLPRVLSRMPSTVCGLDVDVIVVDDGSTDDTAAAVTRYGAYLVSSSRNRGQGAAMRLGYRVARGHGARYIITTDADAQYDTADFPVVLGPVLDGSADFVTGSRRLGHQHTNDRFRRAGVYVFAWIISGLTGERLTDTSFGLRAMRAEVTAAVTLNQPQYQSSELLIGAHSHGFRIAEVPGTMHLRAAGSTKKGGNLVYGMRYARVVLGTWLREGCPAPAGERAPALAAARDLVGSPRPPGR